MKDVSCNSETKIKTVEKETWSGVGSLRLSPSRPCRDPDNPDRGPDYIFVVKTESDPVDLTVGRARRTLGRTDARDLPKSKGGKDPPEMSTGVKWKTV